MSKRMIEDRLDLTKHELSNIFDPIFQNLSIAQQQGQLGTFTDVSDIKKLNALFIPLINSSPTVSSFLLADEDGNEYMVLDLDSLWKVRITHLGSKTEYPTDYYLKKNPTGQPVLIKEIKDTVRYDPRKRPWFKLALDRPTDTSFSWTDPYIFFTTRQPGITGSVRYIDPHNNKRYVIGMDVLISSISYFSTNIDVTTNGKIFVLSSKYDVIGLPRDPRFRDPTSLEKYTLKPLAALQIPLLDKAFDQFQSDLSDQKYHTFMFGKDRWWFGISTFPLSEKNQLLIGAVVPESDFSGEIAQTRKLLIGGLVLIFLFFLIILYSFFKMKKAHKLIAIERDKNEQLLLNTLPAKVVNDLKENGIAVPQKFNQVTVCFIDIVGFTKVSATLDPKVLINELNDIYTSFDEIMIKHECERIKTIGDAYLAVCGMPQPNDRQAVMMLRASLEIIDYINHRNTIATHEWKIRVGIHSGPVVGGIIGIKKYIYDVFGDTINTASRMESNSEPMLINLSKYTYQLLKDDPFVKQQNIVFVARPPILVKGKGTMHMYFVENKH